MENQEFDQLARESAETPTRRTIVRGIAAVLGAAGLGLSIDARAGNKKKRNKKKNKKQTEQIPIKALFLLPR